MRIQNEFTCFSGTTPRINRFVILSLPNCFPPLYLARNIESLQSSLDTEIKARSEAVRSKKKLEGDMADLEIQLAHANRQKSEFQRQVKEIANQVKEHEMQIDEVEREIDGHKGRFLFLLGRFLWHQC